MENISAVLCLIFVCLWALIMLGNVIRFYAAKFAPIKTVTATVIEKNVIESFSRHTFGLKQRKYVIVFSVNGTKKGFYVSEFSFGGYKVGETGTLKYQANRLIDFS